jgi:hypothetical protein
MPRPTNLIEAEITLEGGYFPSVPDLSPKNYQNTINAGSNVWLRPAGKIEVANGLSEVSSTNVGARIFAADIERATIEGGLSGNRLPYAGLLRCENAVLFFLSEETDAQVFINETAVTGLTTASGAGRLRIAVPDGAGGYDTYDAGFEKAPMPQAGSTFGINPGKGVKDMKGSTGIALSRWRITTNAWGPPCETIYSNLAPGTNSTLDIDLRTFTRSAGQDGWIISGTRWGDRSGTLRIVRYIRDNIRGTFTLTNGSPNVTAGIGTRFTQDIFRGDTLSVDASLPQILSVTDDSNAVLTANWAGSTGSKTATMAICCSEWYDSELGEIVSRDIQKPPRAAGVLQYGGRVFTWGIGDTVNTAATLPTGPAIAACEENNPEHIGLLFIVTASGSDLVNVLAGDGPMYLMTTTSLEVVSFTGSADTPYVIRIVAEPGFAAATNGVLYADYFYGYNGKPLRTRADDNIDVLFAQPVWEDMREWDAERVMLAVDPKNQAVLYMFDDGETTTVIPFMTQLGVWSPPLNFGARIIDSAVVNGALYVTYLSGGNYRVNEWEGGSGIGGTRYAASQYLDPNLLNSNRLKQITPVGKLGSLSVFTATPDAAVPDVSDLSQAAATFMLSDSARKFEPTIHTNLPANAVAVRVDFASNDGSFDKVVLGGLPRGGRR